VPKKFYSQTPVVSAKAIAGKNPIPGPSLGSNVSPTVPQEPGKMHGLGPQGKPFRPGHVRGAGEIITHDRLTSLLSYDPTTGIFRWRRNHGNVRSGSIAGTPSGGDNGGGKYWAIRIDKKSYYGHLLAWFYTYKVWLPRLDHKNRDGWDNSIDNLRPATVVQNAANSPVRRNNRLGLKGVRKRKNRYEARISAGSKEVVLGHFDTAEEAHVAYLAELRRRFGEFAGA
jgi:hypothetical protein